MYILEDTLDFESARKRTEKAFSSLEASSARINIPCSQVFFDYGRFTSKEFFGVLKILCDLENEDGYTFIVTNPDPVSYFFKHFNWLPAASISRNDSYEAFAKFVTKNPGDSPADAIAYRSDEIMMASDNNSFFVYGNRTLELGTIIVPGRSIDFFGSSIFALYVSILMDGDMARAHLRSMGREFDAREIARFGLGIR